jgi:photosystem II stability/assembly factor-like uncharacterized protein
VIAIPQQFVPGEIVPTNVKAATRSYALRRTSRGSRFRIISVVALSALCLIVAGGSIAAASRTSTKTDEKTSVGAHSTTSPSQWISPANQVDAPAVLISGGASMGAGGINAISCATAERCVEVGGDNNLSGIAATSSNDGAIWNVGTMSEGEPQLDGVNCPSSSDCVAVGDGVTATSNDGGNSWTSNAIPTANTTLLGVSCASTSTCVSVGVTPGNNGPYGGQVLLSSDGGTTWVAPTVPFIVGALGSVDCPSATFCVAVGAQILVSNDGGQTWSPRFVDDGTGVLRSVSCSSATVCVAIGANPAGLVKASDGAYEIMTDDGGATWTSVTMPAGSSLIDAISCSNLTDCVVGGSSIERGTAAVWASSDGGNTWTSMPIPAGASIVSALQCTSAAACIFVGQQGSAAVSGTLGSGSPGSVNSESSVVASSTAGSL